MSIRKIILEEVNDFDWAKDVIPFDPNGEWILKFDNPSDYHNIQEWLFSKGVFWDGNDEDYNVWSIGGGTFGFFFKRNDKGFDAYTYKNYDGDMDNQIETMNHTEFHWDAIKHTMMNESNDFDWAKDTPIRYGNDNMPSIGDKVRTLHGFSNDWDYGAYSKEDDDPMCGGYGYKENYTFIIYDIDDADEVGGDRGIVWPEDGDGGGIYVDAIEPYDAK